MRQLIATLLALTTLSTLSAQTTAEEWVSALNATLGERYATHIVVEASGMETMQGYFMVEGDSYYLTLGAMEVYSDGELRYEINNERKEVVEDRVVLDSRDLLSNPTRAFDFVAEEYNIEVVGVPSNDVQLRITSKSEADEGMTIYLVLRRTASGVEPCSVTYDYGGDSYTVSLSVVRSEDMTKLPRWDKGAYRAYDIVSFL